MGCWNSGDRESEPRGRLFWSLGTEGLFLRPDLADQRAHAVGGTGVGLIFLLGYTPDIFVAAITGQLSSCHRLAVLLLAARRRLDHRYHHHLYAPMTFMEPSCPGH